MRIEHVIDYGQYDTHDKCSCISCRFPGHFHPSAGCICSMCELARWLNDKKRQSDEEAQPWRAIFARGMKP